MAPAVLYTANTRLVRFQYAPPRNTMLDDYDLDRLKRKNNPNNEPTGDYTGRCKKCGSTNLWDDASAYGCNDCKAIYFTG